MQDPTKVTKLVESLLENNGVTPPDQQQQQLLQNAVANYNDSEGRPFTAEQYWNYYVEACGAQGEVPLADFIKDEARSGLLQRK